MINKLNQILKLIEELEELDNQNFHNKKPIIYQELSTIKRQTELSIRILNGDFK